MKPKISRREEITTQIDKMKRMKCSELSVNPGVSSLNNKIDTLLPGSSKNTREKTKLPISRMKKKTS
jgi:hypothetical protein